MLIGSRPTVQVLAGCCQMLLLLLLLHAAAAAANVPLLTCCAQDSHHDDLPDAYGSSSHEETQHIAAGTATTPSAPEHNPLAPVSHDSANPLWQHYPEPVATTVAERPLTVAAGNQASSSSGAGARYPAVPTATDFNVPLSPTSTFSGSGTPSAAAVGAAAAALALAAAAQGGAVSPPPVGNPELRIVVQNPLKHMGPSGLVPGGW